MKIAVTYQDGDIFQHFGHTEFFKIYDIENTDIVKTEIVSTNGSGHGALAQFLHEHSVDTLICGGIGGGAQMALSQAGIKLYGGVTGKAVVIAATDIKHLALHDLPEQQNSVHYLLTA